MSNFTDRMVVAGIPLAIANDMENDLRTDIAKAKAERQRLTTRIDTLQTDIDALKTQRTAQVQIIDGIRTALGDPNA